MSDDQSPDPVADYLKSQKTSDVTRGQLWDAFYQSSGPDDLTRKLQKIGADPAIKAQLWDLKQKATTATTADPLMDELESVQKGAGATATSGQSWTDMAVNALPAAGGVVGGIVGGAGGTVGGFGVGGVPGAIGGAAVGGAGGEAARQLINRARGVDTSADPVAAAKNIGQEGLIQGALEGAGGLVAKGAGMVARPLMENAIRPAIGLAERFPNIIETAIKERLPVGNLIPGMAKGSVQAAAARGEAAREVTKLLTAAAQGGKVFDPAIVVAKPIQDLLADIAQQPLGDVERQRIVGMLTEYLSRHPGPVNPLELKALKSSAQAIAKPIYRAVARGEAVGPEQALGARFNSAVATGAKDALETVPGVAAGEARTQSLIGATQAIKRSELRRLSLMAESLSGAAGTVAAVLGPKGDLPSDLKNGAITWMITRGMMSPRATSRAALALTQPQLRALFQQFPRIAYAVVHEATRSPEGASTAAASPATSIEEPDLR